MGLGSRSPLLEGGRGKRGRNYRVVLDIFVAGWDRPPESLNATYRVSLPRKSRITRTGKIAATQRLDLDSSRGYCTFPALIGREFAGPASAPPQHSSAAAASQLFQRLGTFVAEVDKCSTMSNYVLLLSDYYADCSAAIALVLEPGKRGWSLDQHTRILTCT